MGCKLSCLLGKDTPMKIYGNILLQIKKAFHPTGHGWLVDAQPTRRLREAFYVTVSEVVPLSAFIFRGDISGRTCLGEKTVSRGMFCPFYANTQAH